MRIPVKKNEIKKIEIIDLNHRGQGVAKIEGFTIFIDGGLPGDKGEAKIIDVKKNYAKGKMISITEPSKDRTVPKCPISGMCGGCQLQGLSYDAQLELKTNKVKNDLKRIGNIEDVTIHDTIGMDEPFNYRNKAQFPVRKGKKGVNIGFYERGSHDIVDTKSCIIQHSLNDKVLEIVKEYMNKYNITSYDEKSGKGIVRHVLTKTSFKTEDMMIVIITKGNKLPHKEKLIDLIKESIPNVKSIIQNINNKKTNRILGNKWITIYGDNKIVDYIQDLKFNISAESFFQVNPIQTEVLYNKALEYADLTGYETVFDLYCGIGSISLFLAKEAKKVYGIEVVKKAIQDAKENAELNNVENAEFYAGTAEEVFPKLYSEGIKADVVVIDPPRKGCDETVLDTIVKMGPKKVVYVSCNPSTLARDLKYLGEHGYGVKEVQPVDMFPHTMHVECCCLLKKI